MEISIAARSSSSDREYRVYFNRHEGKLSAFCDCPAGVLRKFCKHKWQFLNGDNTLLAREDDLEKLKQVASWAQESGFKRIYDEVNELEEEVTRLKSAIKEAKRTVEVRLVEGF